MHKGIDSSAIDWSKIGLLIGVLIVVAIAGFFLLTQKPFPFSMEESGVLLASKTVPVEKGIADFSGHSSYLVAVELRQGEGISNQYLANGQTLFSVVLTGNQKNVILLYKSFDQNGSLIGCRTNHGDVLRDEELSIAQCDALWNNFSGGRVLVAWPDSSLSIPRVVFEGNTVIIQSNSFESISKTSFLVLKKTFSNSQAIIDQVNDISGRVG